MPDQSKKEIEMVKQNDMIQLIVLTNRCGKRERVTSVTQTKVNCYKSNRGCRGYSNTLTLGH